jgi:hypothetical protein
MSVESSNDPRDRLVREKYFTLRPKPLERWLWQKGLPQAAERVFWLHWEEGMRNRDWCSEIPLRRAASLCCIDPSTVTRAYQLLKKLDLIRREDPGRDPHNPFQQATAITEVRIPRELLTELSRSPNRPKAAALKAAATSPHSSTSTLSEPCAESSRTTSAPLRSSPTRQEIQAMWNRASAAERSRFFEASRKGNRAIEFDGNTALTSEDRGAILKQLEQMAATRSQSGEPPKSVHSMSASLPFARCRRLSALELARAHRCIIQSVPAAQAPELLRQVIWAVEEGALRRFEVPLAINVALKKIREGAWSRPNRMPSNWARISAPSEACRAA